MKQTRICISMPEDELILLKALALKEGRKVSNLAVKLIKIGYEATVEKIKTK